MGRYYDGDIEGKFWFAIQDSNAADRFGVEGCEPNYLDYYFDKSNLDDIQNEIAQIKKNLRGYKTKIDKFFGNGRAYTHEQLAEFLGVDLEKCRYLLSEYADLGLGQKILNCVKQNGCCEFRAEL
jgi:hypothetical protein